MEINKLVLHSQGPLAQKVFYHDLLGMKVNTQSDSEVSLQAGTTELVFRLNEDKTLYHYCFLIPEGRLKEAILFMRTRKVNLLKYEDEVIVNFPTGRSIYFYDADGHIAEFIERPSLNIKDDKSFSMDSIVKINEIGVPDKDPDSFGRRLISSFGIKILDPPIWREDFCWVGDFNGVFIVPKIGRHWIPTQDPAVLNDFEVEFSTTKGRFTKRINNNQFFD